MQTACVLDSLHTHQQTFLRIPALSSIHLMCLLFARSSKLASPDYVPGLRGHARFCQLLRVGGAEVGLTRDHEPHGVLRLLEGLVVLLPSLEDVLGDAVKVRVRERTWGKIQVLHPATKFQLANLPYISCNTRAAPISGSNSE